MIDIQLITVDEIKNYTPVSNQVDSKLLEPYISMSQVFHYKNTLGDALYNDLLLHISGDTLTGNNYTLVYQYIRPGLIWYCFYEALPFIWAKVSAKGITKGSSENSESVSQKELSLLRQNAIDNATAFKNMMIDYLEKNINQFPKYRDSGSSLKTNSTGIFLGKEYDKYNYKTGEFDCCS